MTAGPELVLVLVGAFAAGAVNSTVGGGGLIQLPALLAAYPQMPPATAIGSSKLASILGTASAVFRYSRHVAIPWRVVLPGSGLAFLASVGGAAAVSVVPPDTFRALVPIMLAAVLAFVLAHKNLGATHAPLSLDALRIALAAALFVAMGFFDGFFGPGVGTFLMLLFIRLFGFDFLHAAASARVVNFASNAAALSFFGMTGQVSWALGTAMAACNVAGAQAGTALALRHGSRYLRQAFILIVCILVVRTAWDAWPASRT